MTRRDHDEAREALEARLRSSLAARAENVEPTPHLWLRVRDRIDRRRWVRPLVLAAGVAAAATLAVLVVPQLLPPARPQILDTPTAAPPTTTSAPSPAPGGASEPATRAPTPEGQAAPARGYVQVDRGDGAVTVHGPDGALVDTLVPGRTSPEAEFFPVAAAVRPGSTPEDATVALLEHGEGFSELSWVRSRGELTRFAPPYQAQSNLAPGSQPVPRWSPDGAYLAWVEVDGSNGDIRLMIVGWSDGPGTGRTADDNTSFVLNEQLPGVVEARLDAFELVGDEGLVRIRGRGEEGARVYTIEVTRQADGAIALSSAPAQVSDGGVADVATVGEGTYVLDVSGGEPALRLETGGAQRDVALPDGFAREPAGDLATYWQAELVGTPEGALLSDGTGAWWWLTGTRTAPLDTGVADIAPIP